MDTMFIAAGRRADGAGGARPGADDGCESRLQNSPTSFLTQLCTESGKSSVRRARFPQSLGVEYSIYAKSSQTSNSPAGTIPDPLRLPRSVMRSSRSARRTCGGGDDGKDRKCVHGFLLIFRSVTRVMVLVSFFTRSDTGLLAYRRVRAQASRPSPPHLVHPAERRWHSASTGQAPDAGRHVERAHAAMQRLPIGDFRC
jgi:hypothetical protein